MAYYRKGGTSPHIRLALWSPGIHGAMNIQIAEENGGGGSMGTGIN